MKPNFNKMINRFSTLILATIVLLVFYNCNQTNKIKAFEQTSAKEYEDVLRVRYDDMASDSLLYYSDSFSTNFKKGIADNPKTMEYIFEGLLLNNYCYINTSSDGKLRVYSWNKWTGGSMQFFDELYQYKDKSKVYTSTPKLKEGDAGGYTSEIYTVKIENKPVYLVINNGIYSSREVSQSITAFSIAEGKLNKTKLFKTEAGLSDQIKIEYDLFSVVDKPERPIRLITYDEKLNSLYVAVIDSIKLTQDRQRYQLKDNYFEFVGVEKDKG